MIYLSGVHTPAFAALAELPVGIINTPNVSYSPEVTAQYRWWALDNGCFSQGESFDGERFMRWLDRQPRENCLFVVAPDVPYDAKATLAKFWEWSVKIRGLGYNVALAAQNGLEDLGAPWTLLDALFLGGDTAWKLGAEAGQLAWQAHQLGKWVHMGRVNSKRRLARALAMACESADGNFLKRAPDTNVARLRRWYIDLHGQTDLTDRAG